MAYVVRRPKGRWELRESRSTPAGPRSRTLASFAVLDDQAVARATAASGGRLGAAQVRLAARRAGAPVAEARADAAARVLLEELAAGRGPVPHLAGRLAQELRRGQLAERGAVLRELLRLSDRFPATRRGELRFPRLSTEPA